PVGPLEHLLGSITTLAGMATRGRCTCKGLPVGRAPGAARDRSQRAEHAAAASPHDAAGLLLRSFHVGAWNGPCPAHNAVPGAVSRERSRGVPFENPASPHR